MKLKTVTVEGKVYAEVQEGKPVFVHDDGKEIPFDAPQAMQTIAARNGEAKTNRERAETAEGQLKKFEGITDADAAKKALETVSNLDQKKLVDAGKVEEIKTAAIKAIEDKYAPVVEENKKLKGDLHSEMIGGSFARSKLISEKFLIPATMAQDTFGKHFTIESGKIIAKDSAGNQVFSRKKPGEAADFDEALEIIVDGYSHKASILKGVNANGAGGEQGKEGQGGGKTIARADFDKLDHTAKSAKMAEGFSVV